MLLVSILSQSLNLSLSVKYLGICNFVVNYFEIEGCCMLSTQNIIGI